MTRFLGTPDGPFDDCAEDVDLRGRPRRAQIADGHCFPATHRHLLESDPAAKASVGLLPVWVVGDRDDRR